MPKIYEEITVTSSSLAPAANALALSSSVLSPENTRCNSEKMSGASGLDCTSATKPPFHDACNNKAIFTFFLLLLKIFRIRKCILPD